MPITAARTSSYLDYLPGFYREDPFLGAFLLVFEQILTGLGDPDAPGLEERIAGIHRYFIPGPELGDHERAPEEFLDWLAGWVALSLRADWSQAQRREFIGRIVPLYRRRGTKENLKELLRIYTGVEPRIIDAAGTAFQIGVNSTIGVDTQIGGTLPHYFRVFVSLPADPATIERQREIITALIDMEKPAHTFYNRDDPDLISFPTMQIGRTSTIGVDTLLGSVPETT